MKLQMHIFNMNQTVISRFWYRGETKKACM